MQIAKGELIRGGRAVFEGQGLTGAERTGGRTKDFEHTYNVDVQRVNTQLVRADVVRVKNLHDQSPIE